MFNVPAYQIPPQDGHFCYLANGYYCQVAIFMPCALYSYGQARAILPLGLIGILLKT